MVDNSTPEVQDTLSLGSNEVIMMHMGQNETIVFSCETRKLNRWKVWQRRHLLLTNLRLINLQGNKFKRVIPLENITALTKSLEGAAFLIHIANSSDFEFESSSREALVQSVKA